MKRKYQGMLAAIILVSVTAVSVIYGLYGDGAGTQSRMEKVKMSYDQINAPDQKELGFIKRLDKDLSSLVFPGGPDKMPANLFLFGYQYPEENVRQKTVSEPQIAPDIRLDYGVTFVFSSKEGKYCMVDGHFYTEGADLPDGGNIEKIGESAIYIRKNRVGKWIPVEKKGMKKENGSTDDKRS
ncbi:MAG: hypothetical protein KJ737_05650 [Proteobacteria bacterium]|nr:hypothetical protein [Pseudomonadota bacterium]